MTGFILLVGFVGNVIPSSFRIPSKTICDRNDEFPSRAASDFTAARQSVTKCGAWDYQSVGMIIPNIHQNSIDDWNILEPLEYVHVLSRKAIGRISSFIKHNLWLIFIH